MFDVLSESRLSRLSFFRGFPKTKPANSTAVRQTTTSSVPIITNPLAVLLQFDAAYTLHCVYKMNMKLEMTLIVLKICPLKSQA